MLAVQLAGLRDPTDAALEFEEEEEDDEVEEEEELEMFDESIDWFEHSSWRSQRLTLRRRVEKTLNMVEVRVAPPSLAGKILLTALADASVT